MCRYYGFSIFYQWISAPPVLEVNGYTYTNTGQPYIVRIGNHLVVECKNPKPLKKMTSRCWIELSGMFEVHLDWCESTNK
jgi:hypothetical protein